MIGAPSELGKKICQSNQGALVTNIEAFVEPTAAIIYFWGAKVTQLWMGVAEPVKPTCMTDPDPIPTPEPGAPRPEPRRSVGNSSTEQEDSW